MNDNKRNNSVRKQMTEFVIEGYNKGATLTELAEHYKCSPGTISNILKDNKIKARRRGPKKNTIKGVTNGTNEQAVQSDAI